MIEPSTVARDGEIDAPSPDDADTGEPEAALVDEELLVEDVSIDGMCGVY